MPKPPRPSPAAVNLASPESRSSNSNNTTALPSARSAPKPSPKRIDYAAELRAPWYRSARSSYLAIGVAVIAAAGSLFGAQLKTTWQEYQAGQTRALAEGSDQAGADTKTEGTKESTAAAAPGSVEAKKAVAVAGQEGGGDEDISLSDLNRSIATLQTVRGQLVQRRIQEELRLQKLHERVVERREIEARRTQVAGPSR